MQPLLRVFLTSRRLLPHSCAFFGDALTTPIRSQIPNRNDFCISAHTNIFLYQLRSLLAAETSLQATALCIQCDGKVLSCDEDRTPLQALGITPFSNISCKIAAEAGSPAMTPFGSFFPENERALPGALIANHQLHFETIFDLTDNEYASIRCQARSLLMKIPTSATHLDTIHACDTPEKLTALIGGAAIQDGKSFFHAQYTLESLWAQINPLREGKQPRFDELFLRLGGLDHLLVLISTLIPLARDMNYFYLMRLAFRIATHLMQLMLVHKVSLSAASADTVQSFLHSLLRLAHAASDGGLPAAKISPELQLLSRDAVVTLFTAVRFYPLTRDAFLADPAHADLLRRILFCDLPATRQALCQQLQALGAADSLKPLLLSWLDQAVGLPSLEYFEALAATIRASPPDPAVAVSLLERTRHWLLVLRPRWKSSLCISIFPSLAPLIYSCILFL
jgi:hypothetical protein